MMHIVEPPVAARIMAIAAHPDDIESWCGGTLALAVDRGATVRLLLVTSGEHGSDDPRAEPLAIAERRESEAQAAAHHLGITEVAFLRYGDGDVENRRALRSDLVSFIRRWQPDVLFTHDPEQPIPAYLSHPDHRAVGRAALDAVYPLARDHLAFPEHLNNGLRPHVVRDVWLFASGAADAYVDIAGGFERKISARLAHVSQTPDATALSEDWRTRAARIGFPVDLALAEAFTILHL